MNLIDTPTASGRWEVTAAANTAFGSLYFLLNAVSHRTVKVSDYRKSGRRGYVWGRIGEANEIVPPEIRCEIDHAITSYIRHE